MEKKGIGLLAGIIIAAAASRGISAQETLNLERARELALLNSRSLAKYNMAIQSSVLSEKLQGYSDLPSLSLGASASTSLWTKDGSSPDLIKDGFSAGASLGVSKQLWAGGKSSIQKAINSLATEISRQDALAEYFNVLDSADAAYYGVLEAAAGLDAAESSLETSLLSLSIAEIRRESGMISDAAYLQALAEKAGKETSRNQARRSLAMAKLELKELLGLEEAADLAPVDFESREPLILFLANLDESGIDLLFSALWKRIQSANPSLVKAALNSERSEKSVSLSSRDYSPTLSASLSTGLNYSIDGGYEPSGGRLSLSASIPLDVWVTAANVEQRKIAKEQAALDCRGAASSLDLELHRDLLDLVSQAGQILSSRQALDYAQRNFDYALELYRLSGNSAKELSDAETLVRNSRNQLISSQYAFLNGLSKIRSIGIFDSDEEAAAALGSARAE